MILDQFCKGTRETLDYALDFYRELEPEERITGASAIVTPDTLALTRVEFTDDTVRVWVTGGADRVRYTIIVTADTNQGRRREKCFGLQVHGDIVTITSVSIDDTAVTVALLAGNITSEISIDDTAVTIGFLGDAEPSITLEARGAQIKRTSGQVARIKAINWFGFEGSNRTPNGLWADGYKLMIDRMKAVGFNAIRLPFAGNTFAGIPLGVDFNKPGNNVFQDTTPGRVKPAINVMDIIIEYASSVGMWIILDFHRRQLGNGADGNPVGTGQTQQQWLDTWRMLATRYKDNKYVLGADLYNEPHLLTWGAWAGMAELAGNAIHEIAPHWLIFVEGVGTYNGQAHWWGGQLQGARDRPVELVVPNRLVYSPHEYGQSVSDQTWLKSAARPVVANWPDNLPTVWRNAWGFLVEEGLAPVWVGEFGGKFGYNGAGVDNQANGAVEREWGTKLVQYLNQHGISYAYWSYNPNSGDTGGLVQDNWTTLQAGKVALLSPLFGQ